MDYILPYVPESIKSIPTHMDFDGQKRAEKYFQIIIVIFAIIGFACGYITQFFSHTMYILFAGVIISSLLTLIPWSMYRKQPLSWQPARTTDTKSASQATTGGNQLQSKNKKKKLKD
ncbi:signal peptidase complex subunit 1-like [Plakobranchus ocellatus]|uniref:Signal peptidase complex subunit 1 n=1 Tax=Plakobranchus ocellatus TaxID=259542 RepID=A0AAV4AS95_9GAST|nr:signal peptidase complex subunit 1-like [Plakobranchus ocellatus]